MYNMYPLKLSLNVHNVQFQYNKAKPPKVFALSSFKIMSKGVKK
jgi:hypothetical protein